MCSSESVTQHDFCDTSALYPTKYINCFIGVGNGSYHRNCSEDAECSCLYIVELYLVLTVVGAIIPLKLFYSL